MTVDLPAGGCDTAQATMRAMLAAAGAGDIDVAAPAVVASISARR